MVYQKNNFKTIRPLLNTHRFEIRQFIRFWKLPIYSDKSNQKTNYLRNKIRKQLMPTLRILFNPQIDTVLLNFVQIRKDEQLYFQNILNLLLKPQSCHPLFNFSCYRVAITYQHSSPSHTPSGYVMALSVVRDGENPKDDRRLSVNSYLSHLDRRCSPLLESLSPWVKPVTNSKKFLLKNSSSGGTSSPIYGLPSHPYVPTPHPSGVVLPTPAATAITEGVSRGNEGIRVIAEGNVMATMQDLSVNTRGITQSNVELRSGPSFYVPTPHPKGVVLPLAITLHPKGVLGVSRGNEGVRVGNEKVPAATCKYNGYWLEQQVVRFTCTPSSYRPKSQIKITIQPKGYLYTFSRNQVIHWLIINNGLVKKIKYYPNVFQKQVLKTIFKTFSRVENFSLNLKSQHYEEKLTQLLIIKFTKKLFTREEKESLLIILKNIISKY